MMNDYNINPDDILTNIETAPVVMSSRIRLARNLENHVHPLMFPSEQEGFRVINEVQDALPDLDLQRQIAWTSKVRCNLLRNI